MHTFVFFKTASFVVLKIWKFLLLKFVPVRRGAIDKSIEQ